MLNARTISLAAAVALASCLFTALGPIPAASGADVSGVVNVRGARTAADVVVYLEQEGLATKPPAEPYVLDQKELIFIPRVLPIIKGGTVEFPNNDTVRHNVFSPRKSAKRFNLGTYPPGATRTETFEQAGVVPLLCNVHSEMVAYLVVLETPYFVTTDRAGKFSIKGVPAGQYTLKTWHDRAKGVEQPLTVGADGVADLSIAMRGR